MENRFSLKIKTSNRLKMSSDRDDLLIDEPLITISKNVTNISPSEYGSTIEMPKEFSRYLNIPPEGIILSKEIILPSQTLPRSDIINFAHSIGMNPTISWTRQQILSWLEKQLAKLDYKETNGIWIRKDNLRLLSEANRSKSASQIKLPKHISYRIFTTKRGMIFFIQSNDLQNFIRSGSGRLKSDIRRDIYDFLVSHGYAIDREGNFISQGEIIIKSGYKYHDLINPQIIIDFIKSPEDITISQPDLVQLNIMMMNILSNITNKYWISLDDLVQDINELLHINAGVIKLAIVVDNLNIMNDKQLRDILQGIGNAETFRRSENRLLAIYNYLRSKIRLIPNSYKLREPLKETAPQTLTFKEAVEQGYNFTYDQYKKDIDNMTNYEKFPTYQMNYLLKLLQYYPDMFDPMNKFRITDTLARKIIRMYFDNSPTIVQELYAYAVNYVLSFPESKERIERRQNINILPHSYLDALYEIYKTRDTEQILDMKQNPLELYLTAISKVRVDQLRQLVLGFGMVIPEHLTNIEIRRYVLQHIASYKQIIIRPQEILPIKEIIRNLPNNTNDLTERLNYYTDMEIIQSFGYTGGFENRIMLISNIFDTLNESGFMVFNEYDLESMQNRETTLLEEIKDLPKPYLAFGTLLQYYVIDLNELLIAFREESGEFRFQNIYGSDADNYTISQISRLQIILPMMKATNPQLTELVDQVLVLISKGIIRNIRRNGKIDNIISEIGNQPLEVKNIIKDIFYKIFYAGMYMRKWGGPGNRYPLKSMHTYGNTNPIPRSIITLGEISEQMSQIESIDENLYNRILEFPIVYYNTESGDIIFRIDKIFDRISKIADGESCIRASSKDLVSSSYYYISVIFDEVIPDFDPYSVDAIS